MLEGKFKYNQLLQEDENYNLKWSIERKNKEYEKLESSIQYYTKQIEELKGEIHNYNIYSSGIAKESIRALAQETNSTLVLTQINHNSKEYAKGLKILIDESVRTIMRK